MPNVPKSPRVPEGELCTHEAYFLQIPLSKLAALIYKSETGSTSHSMYTD